MTKKIIVEYFGGYDVSALINESLDAMPIPWIDLSKQKIFIYIVQEKRLPRGHNTWGSHDTSRRPWSIKMVRDASPGKTEIFVHVPSELITRMVCAFKRDIVTAIILDRFADNDIASIIKSTLHHWSAKRYQLSIVLAEIIASFIVNNEKAEVVQPQMILPIGKLNQSMLNAYATRHAVFA